MIDLDSFITFIRQNFQTELTYIDRFKKDVLFVEIDCLNGTRKLAIRATDEKIEFSTISKEPELDFSLYDYSILDQEQAEKLILRIKEMREFVFP